MVASVMRLSTINDEAYVEFHIRYLRSQTLGYGIPMTIHSVRWD